MTSQSVVGRPSTKISPLEGNSRPFTIFSAVVLPEPLRPNKTSVSPGSIRKLKIVQDQVAADAKTNVREIPPRHSLRDPEALDERPLAIHPLRPDAETGLCGHCRRSRRN